jgi:hypothetical protein
MITIDGTEYKEDDFTDEQKYMLAQVKDLQTKEEQLKFNLHQMTVAKQGFVDALSKSLRPSEAESNEPD